jgi:hypothetical protein
MPAAKKFTARNAPALLALAAEFHLSAHKVDSKTYQFAPMSQANNQLVGLSCEDMQSMDRFVERADSDFLAYDLDIDPRGNFVSVSWAKRTARTESQMNNVD